jgi:transposase InsO family protein
MVASVGRITAGSGYDYLTRDVATLKHDYYTGKGEAAGVWAGRGAPLIGLVGEVDADDMAVLYGRFVVPSTAGGTRRASELVHRYRFSTRAEARRAIFAWINRYNSRRRHSSLGYIAPITWEQQYCQLEANPAA